jgi:hypothetical protein
MTITFTEHDRKLLMKRFRAASKNEKNESIVTIFHVTEVYAGQQEE